MSWLRLLPAVGIFASAIATPLVIHEKREVASPYRGERVAGDAIIPMRIALRQNNLHLGYDRLMDVSDPDSPQYGKHLTAEEVHDLFAPAKEAVDAVKEWLVSSGINLEDIRNYENKGWLAVDVTAEHAERLLATEYYEHHQEETVRIGCDAYSLPAHLSEHVDFIKPGLKLSAPLNKRSLAVPETLPRMFGGHTRRLGGYMPLPRFHEDLFPDFVPPPGAEDLAPHLQNCGANITIQCIQALYSIPKNTNVDPQNVMGLYETFDAFSAEDIGLFFAKFAPWVPPETLPKVISVDGGTAPVNVASVRNSGESDIDLDLTTSLLFPQKVHIYQVDDIPNSEGETRKSGFLNTWLDSIDGSYCTTTAFGITGDSPNIDAVYPDTLKGGFKGQLECGTHKLTRVVSISYGEAEVDLPKKYVERQCNEFMKLGLQGHSILVSSSDFGVAASPGANGDEFGCLSGHGQKGTIYNPDYPSGCPFITSVGGTRLFPSDTVEANESAMQVNLTAFNIATGFGPTTPPFGFFASGGGFSNYFAPPKYQAEVVSNYLALHAPELPSYVINKDATNIGEAGGFYNRAGRAYPDVSANGAFLRIFNNATEHTFFGTSLSSPIFGSVLTLINEQRTVAGKGPVGFVNAVLYKNPQVLNDITNGSNPNCGSAGFSCSVGWDPVTGLGTPNYPKMLELFMSLP